MQVNIPYMDPMGFTNIPPFSTKPWFWMTMGERVMFLFKWDDVQAPWFSREATTKTSLNLGENLHIAAIATSKSLCFHCVCRTPAPLLEPSSGGVGSPPSIGGLDGWKLESGMVFSNWSKSEPPKKNMIQTIHPKKFVIGYHARLIWSWLIRTFIISSTIINYQHTEVAICCISTPCTKQPTRHTKYTQAFSRCWMWHANKSHGNQ